MDASRRARIAGYLSGPDLPPLEGEPPGIPLGLKIDVTSTSKALALLDESDARLPRETPEADGGLGDPSHASYAEEMEASTTVAVRDAVDPQIQRLRELCAGEGLPEQTWEPPGRPLGITIDVTNTGRLLALLDELEREDAP